MVRPPLLPSIVDPLGIDGAPPPGFPIGVGARGRPVWMVPDDGVVLVPRVHAAAVLDNADPASRTLAAVGQLVARPGLMQPLRAFQTELSDALSGRPPAGAGGRRPAAAGVHDQDRGRASQ